MKSTIIAYLTYQQRVNRFIYSYCLLLHAFNIQIMIVIHCTLWHTEALVYNLSASGLIISALYIHTVTNNKPDSYCQSVQPTAYCRCFTGSRRCGLKNNTAWGLRRAFRSNVNIHVPTLIVSNLELQCYCFFT